MQNQYYDTCFLSHSHNHETDPLYETEGRAIKQTVISFSSETNNNVTSFPMTHPKNTSAESKTNTNNTPMDNLHKQPKDINDYISAYCTLFLAVITIILFYYSIRFANHDLWSLWSFSSYLYGGSIYLSISTLITILILYYKMENKTYKKCDLVKNVMTFIFFFVVMMENVLTKRNVA